VLRAARDAGVQRVVLTSSFAAIGYGHEPQSRPFDETHWTNLENRNVTAYDKSKTIAERAAWEFIEEEGDGLELSAVNPVAVLGPVLGSDYSVSILLVQRLMAGEVPGCPKLWLGIVDVRDVAELHVQAMISPAAQGERFLAVAGEFLPMRELARILRANLGPKAKRVPKWELPNWAVRIAALRDPAVRLILPELGKIKQASHSKATKVLGWMPRSNEKAILATAESLLRLGLLPS
jgi:nucleoside-diphosphate-sugar epimerase